MALGSGWLHIGCAPTVHSPKGRSWETLHFLSQRFQDQIMGIAEYSLELSAGDDRVAEWVSMCI